jgi:peptidyl-dipeptidase A
MKDALDKIAFLPFGKLIDQWRWDVFSGKTTPDQYNAAWWALRAKYQGIAPPSDRKDPDFFDAGRQVPRPRERPVHPLLPRADPPVPVPQGAVRRVRPHRTAARVLDLRQDRRRRQDARHARPRRQQAMARGPRAITGTREMDAQPMIEYFDPLLKWLAEQNKSRTCGW